MYVLFIYLLARGIFVLVSLLHENAQGYICTKTLGRYCFFVLISKPLVDIVDRIKQLIIPECFCKFRCVGVRFIENTKFFGLC